jgi:hypothetical protein
MTLPAGTTTVLAAPRQFWLATLGAAAVTREWAGKEARTVFRALINEGTVVETRAIRVVARRIEPSMARANALVRDASSGVGASVVACVDAAPVFEPAEHVLDPVALTVEGAVVVDGYLAVGL